MTWYGALPDMPVWPRRTEYEDKWFAQYGSETSSYKNRLRRYFGNLKRWLIATRGPSCEACGVTLSTTTDAHKHLVTHHIVPRASGGVEQPDNLILLCGDCHSSQHDHAIRGKARPALPSGVTRPPQEDSYLSLAQLVDAAIARKTNERRGLV